MGLVLGGVGIGASGKSQGLPPRDSSKISVTASAVGTSNEPSTAFSIPRLFNRSVLYPSYLSELLYLCAYAVLDACTCVCIAPSVREGLIPCRLPI